MENTYILKFEMPYIDCGNFKEKEILVINSIISGARVGQLLYFNGYGNISFNQEDKQHWKPIVTYLDGFSRSKTNCICYGIPNCKRFDRVFVYYNGVRDSLYFGLLFYNTQTNDCLHLYNFTYDYTNLIVNLARVIQKYLK